MELSVQPGWFVGDEHDTAKYRLRRFVARGGEGELWEATRKLDGADHRWAIKILHGRHLERGDDETVRDALNRWRRIWQDTIDRTMELRDLTGIVPTHSVFSGPSPHPVRDAAGPLTSLYLVTPWVDGKDLHTWRRDERRDVDAVADVVGRLADLLDRLAARGFVHRDVSPRNVMIGDDGRVSLIDFAFMRPAGAAATHIVVNDGFSPPEQDISPARDRYAFGGVVYQLLTDDRPPSANAREAVRRGLVTAGFAEGLADHVAGLLDPDPSLRPRSLSTWALSFRRLVSAPSTPGAYRDVAAAVDASGAVELIGAGTGPVGVGRLSPSMHPVLRPAERGPSGALSVAAARRGNGDVLLVARTAQGTLCFRTDRRWHSAEGVVPAGPVRAAAHGDGSVSAFTTDDRGALVTVTVPLTGPPAVTRLEAGLRRVFAASTGPDGRPVLAAEAADGALLCGPPDDLSAVGLRDVDAADLCANEWGELVCVAIEAPNDRLAVAETIVGAWDDPQWEPAPKGVTGIACAGHRNGVTIAAAAASGLWVRAADDWTSLWPEPVDRVVAVTGRHVTLAAVAAHRVVTCTESSAGAWPGQAVLVKG